MAESYISEIGDKYGGSGVSNSAGEHVKIIAPKVYETSTSSIVNLTSAFAAKVNTASVGVANGVASLNSNGKVPTGQLPTLQSLTAGTDLKISSSIISVNTNGTVGNSAEMSFVAGSGTYATGYGAAAFGVKSSAFDDYSFAAGDAASAYSGSFSFGHATFAGGIYSFAEGYNTTALGQNTHAEGFSTYASGTSGTHAEGCLTQAKNHYAHAEGYATRAVGVASHAEGTNTSAFGDGSHSEGIYSFIAIESKASHCGGMNNTIVGEALLTAANINAIDLGSITSLSSWNSKPPKLPGQLNSYNDRIFPGLAYDLTNYYNDFGTARGTFGSQAVLGLDNTAIGRASTVIGYNNVAISPYTFVAGKGNIALDYGQTVIGPWAETRYISNSARFVVGVGSGNDARKNGLVVTDSAVEVPLPIYEKSHIVVGDESVYPLYYTTIQAGYVNTYYKADGQAALQNTALNINGDLNVNGDISFQTLHANKIASNSDNGLKIWGTSSDAGNPSILIPSASNGVMEINNSVAINNDLGVNGNIITTSSVSGHIINDKDSEYFHYSSSASFVNLGNHLLSGVQHIYFLSTNAFTALVPYTAIKQGLTYHFYRMNNTANSVYINLTGIPTGATAIRNGGSAYLNDATTFEISLGGGAGHQLDILRVTGSDREFIWNRT